MCFSRRRSNQLHQGSGVLLIIFVKVLILVLLHEELGNIVPAAYDIFQHINIVLVSLSGNILVLIKPIKILIIPQYIFFG